MNYPKKRKMTTAANKISNVVEAKKKALELRDEVERVGKIQVCKISFEDACDSYATIIAEYSSLIIKIKRFVNESDAAYIEMNGTLRVLQSLLSLLKQKFDTLDEENYAD